MDGGQSVMEKERIFSADQIVVHPELGKTKGKLNCSFRN